jgi:glycosyltransferase involved in cell wall biosynthesis
MNRVLLFGSLVHPEAVKDIPEASEAANRFQLGMLNGLVAAGVKRATAITALPIAAVPWPRKLFVRSQSWIVGDPIEIVAPGFVNLPPIKPVSVHRRLKRAGILARAGVGAVLAYNAIPGPGSAGLAVARKLGVPFVCIVADFDPSLRGRSALRAGEQWWSNRIVRESDGLVVLSGHTARELAGDRPWIKIDGGVGGDWDEPPDISPLRKTVVYAGTPAFVSGARLLLEAFARVDDSQLKLVFAGRGGLESEIRAAASRDARIEIRGFMTREQLQRILVSATVLINPRLSAATENRYNFPSKILDYLASGRPVITTLAGDLDPAYADVAIPLRDETPGALAALMQEVAARPEQELTEIGARGREFVLAKRRWVDQAAEVYRFIETLVAARC